MCVSVFCPFENAQLIFAVSPCLNLALTAADLSAGIAHVRPATLMDVVESAEMTPRASLFSGRLGAGRQPFALLTSAAEPAAVPPPILPPWNPVAGSNVAETFATSFALGSCARPTPSAESVA